MSLAASRLVNDFIKITACVYRPWIVDSRVQPYKAALEDATGYSLPSGHATSSSVLFLGSLLKGKLGVGLKIILIACLAILCFSRLYLGVHTILDILVGIVSTLVVLVIIGKLFDKMEDNPNMDLIIVGVGILISVLLIAYATLKSYPMDYDAAGKLIVDPAKMALETFKDAGFSIGLLVSWLIERRFIKFSSEGSIDKKILRLIGGFIGLQILMYILYPIVSKAFIPQVGRFLSFFMFPFFFIVVMPAIIRFFQNRNPRL